MTYQEHIDKLAAELGCEVVQLPEMAGMMYVEFEPPKIEGPTIQDPPTGELAPVFGGYRYPSAQACYMVMLHELGHVKWGHTQGRPPFQDKKFYFENGVLKSEAQAWEYALDKRLRDPELTDETRKFMWEVSLGSYYRGAEEAGYDRKDNRLYNGNRHHVQFQYDKPDNYFWIVKKRMEKD